MMVSTLLVSFPFEVFGEIPIYRNSIFSDEERAVDLLSRMTLEEKVGQMTQYLAPNLLPRSSIEVVEDDASVPKRYEGLTQEVIYQMVERGEIGSFLNFYADSVVVGNKLQEAALSSRLGIPLLFGGDAIHGHAMAEGSTVFPVPIGLAASFDETLLEKVSRVTAKEMRATGLHWAFFPNVEVSRDVRWGRVGETFGEDPLLVSRLGVASVRGLQRDLADVTADVLSCVKHYLGGSEPIGGRNHAPADFSERTLREVFLPPFVDAVKAGAFTIMVAHNEVNGVPCHANRYLLTDVLKNELGFEGFLVSDWLDVSRLETTQRIASSMAESSELAVAAGLDMNMHGPGFFPAIVAAVREGRLDEAKVDDAVRRILIAKFAVGLFEHPFTDIELRSRNLHTEEHVELALEAARKSLVLLRNEGDLLPVAERDLGRVFVSGPNVDNSSALGDWATPLNAKGMITVRDGFVQLLGSDKLDYFECGPWDQLSDETISRAARKARKADLAVLVVGGHPHRGGGPSAERTEGENWDRSYLGLPGRQLEFVQKIQATGVPLVVVLYNGGPMSIPWISKNVPAVIEAFYPGRQGGLAVAEAILGEFSPSGRMPYSVPHGVGHLPAYYYQRPGYLAVNGKFAGEPLEKARVPLYQFGFGLSYTEFEYSNLRVSKGTLAAGETVELSVEVENVGSRAGDEIVLTFVRDLKSSVTMPIKLLKGFTRVSLEPGQVESVKVELKAEAFSLLDISMRSIVEPGQFFIEVGDASLYLELQ